MAIDINSLFTPAQSGVTQGNAGAAPPTGTWFSQLLANAATLGLATTAWQSGSGMRTILAICANMLAQEDAIVSIMAQGGFLDFAATGAVTYVAANGISVTQPVSPDPSIPGQNPTAFSTWLDVLADSTYNVQRIGAQYASNTIAIANTTASIYGPYLPGTYHISNPTTGAGYSNSASLTIAAQSLVGTAITAASNTAPIQITTSTVHGLASGAAVQIAGVTGNTAANGIFQISVTSTTQFTLNASAGNGVWASGGTVNVCTTAPFQADVAGPVGTAVTGAISATTTVLSGVSVSNLVAFFGQAFESNPALAARCRLKLQSLSPNGPAAAYKYFALTSAALLLAQTPAVSLTSAITRATVATSAATGIVTTTIANAGGVVPGISNLAVTAATNAAPIQITTAAHGLSTGNYVTISGVLGNTNANGTWLITVVNGTSFTLQGSTGNAPYTSGGIVEGGDLGEVDSIIQVNAVPDDVTAITQSAIALNVAIVATVTVPQAQAAAYTTAAQTALTNYFASLPIGGLAGATVSYNDILGILYTSGSVAGAASYVVSMSSLTLNGATVDLAYPSASYVAVLSPAPVITVLGV